ncbi:hypothetical protein DMH88_09640 [Escherichia coli]|nr:hypothetical protein [Escherichia coli]
MLYQQEPANLTRPDQLTATDAERAVTRSCRFIAATLSFQGDARVSQTLMARLASLLESHPPATPAKVAILSKPLPLAEQRQWQSQLPGIADNCPAIVRFAGRYVAAFLRCCRPEPSGKVLSGHATRCGVVCMASGRTTTTERATSCGSLSGVSG